VCQGTPAFTESKPSGTGNTTVSTTNCQQGGAGTPDCFIATGEGTWKWQVVYSDGGFSISGACGHESFVINNDPPCGATRTPTPIP
jgi:hypothetical protein